MLSFITRSVLARSATPLRSSLLGSARTTSAIGLSGLNAVNGLNGLSKNTVMNALRAFSLSARVGYPTTTTRKTSSTKKTGATKATKAKKTTASGAAKKKTATKKKAAPKKAVAKKRKVAAKKKPVARKTRVAKKVVEKKPVISPRTTPELRQPPRTISSYSLFLQRVYPTLQPKPANLTEAASRLSAMWKGFSPAEKKAFQDEASTLSAERRAVYAKWRSSLTLGDVRIINAYRANSKGNRKSLGAPPKPASYKPKDPKGFVKFYTESCKNGTIDISKHPEGVRPVVYGTKEAAKLWKGLSESQKQAYM